MSRCGSRPPASSAAARIARAISPTASSACVGSLTRWVIAAEPTRTGVRGSSPSAIRRCPRAVPAPAGATARVAAAPPPPSPMAVEHLHADVVGAGIVMRLHARGDRLLVAPGDQGVDQPVGATVGEVVLGEAEPQEVVGVVRQHQVAGEVLAGDLAGLGPVGLEDDALLGGDERAGAELARTCAVCSGVTR